MKYKVWFDGDEGMTEDIEAPGVEAAARAFAAGDYAEDPESALDHTGWEVVVQAPDGIVYDVLVTVRMEPAYMSGQPRPRP